jgi:nucleoside-diphosphate-sugar epimerase
MAEDTYLVTGALGCIGAWVMRNLVREGRRVVAADLASEPTRARLLMSAEELARVVFVQADVADLEALQGIVARERVTHIIHLAALQTPGCRDNPSLGARVNVQATVNALEAARQNWGDPVRGIAYASSIAVLGPESYYTRQPLAQLPLGDDAPTHPDTLYGVYKQADEGAARLYWQDWRIPSIGVRPYIVYGVARDQGLTSDIAKAILAAAAGRPFQIKFGGTIAVQYADDVARIFIACARAGFQGATACNLCNDQIRVADFVALLREEAPGAQVTCLGDDRPLPFAAALDDSGLRRVLGEVPHTPLREGVRESLRLFRALLDRGLINLAQL